MNSISPSVREHNCVSREEYEAVCEELRESKKTLASVRESLCQVKDILIDEGQKLVTSEWLAGYQIGIVAGVTAMEKILPILKE